ncbi:MAG: steroid 5-alpha reductase family enzyme [Halieaceae bacterium]|jgi:steroid 5-alpha reductase family enzyme
MNTRSSSLLGILAALSIATLVAIAGSVQSLPVYGLPLFSWAAILAFTVQWVFFVPAYLLQTEKFYDLIGSLTYIALALLAVSLSGPAEPGRVLVAGMVVIWATRLGSFLFLRIRTDGRDVRFDKIKPDFLRFLMTWTLQGLWVFFTFAAGLAAITSTQAYPLGIVTIVGAVLWLLGFAIEVVADNQKRRFRAQTDNKSSFIQTGLWAYSRHPNYVGEILLWVGIAIAALPQLTGWQYITLLSPCFVYVLLTQISGVKLLEYRARKQWGDNPDYKAYLARTPVLFPGFNKRESRVTIG